MYLHPRIALPPLEPAPSRRSAQKGPGGAAPAREAEADLISRAIQGERFAKSELCRLHQGALFALLLRLVGHRQDAEDLTQEALVRALRSLHTFRGEAGFDAWLRRIAVHLLHDQRRKLGRRGRHLPLESAADAKEPGESTGEAMEQAELAAQLQRLVLDLPAHLRIPLVLRMEEKRNYEQIAEMTGVKPATCRTQIMKARALLRQGLGDLSAEPS